MSMFLTGLSLNIYTRRPHSKIQYKTPEQKEREYAVTFGIIEIE